MHILGWEWSFEFFIIWSLWNLEKIIMWEKIESCDLFVLCSFRLTLIFNCMTVGQTNIRLFLFWRAFQVLEEVPAFKALPACRYECISQKWTHPIKPHEILDHATFFPLFEQGSRGADGHKGERGSPGEAVRSYDFIPKCNMFSHHIFTYALLSIWMQSQFYSDPSHIFQGF